MKTMLHIASCYIFGWAAECFDGVSQDPADDFSVLLVTSPFCLLLAYLIRKFPYERYLVVDRVVHVPLPLDVDQNDFGAVGLGVDLLDADAVLELLEAIV